MYCERHTVTIQTAADGSGTGYTSVINGRIINVIYNKDGSNAFADGVDFDVSGESSGIVIWDEDNVNASKTVAPRQATHSPAGAAALYAAGGTAVNDHIYIANERVKIQVATGGDTKNGSFDVIVG